MVQRAPLADKAGGVMFHKGARDQIELGGAVRRERPNRLSIIYRKKKKKKKKKKGVYEAARQTPTQQVR